MSKSSKFPWDTLKAETLRAICRDIGIGFVGKRETILSHLQLIHEIGLDKALQKIKDSPVIEPAAARTRKRKSDAANLEPESPPKSRAKRPRPSDAEPASTPRRTRANTALEESPRRSSRKTKPTEKISAKTKVVVKAKPTAKTPSKPKPRKRASAPNSRSSQFDGVVVPRIKRTRPGDVNGAAVEGEGEGGPGSSPVKKQEADDEESKASSSYGSSNKENEEIPAVQDGEDSKEQGPAAPSSGLDETSDADADGSPEPVDGLDSTEAETVDATATT
ncbi:uncharacterized protein ARMOST_09894 [Armillaria ostoyae]|uniref:SAP domain-containing protein n=2 Tax=Armillaria TaxID=47424 RepID=A0A284RCS2_ARMOS|nr:hypothetical protein ARMSODRAFT_979792 [Armillaria solidipes]SJL06553.1 uncharacterized protein ARMOST_09894 [Armillaria ostoyae]